MLCVLKKERIKLLIKKSFKSLDFITECKRPIKTPLNLQAKIKKVMERSGSMRNMDYKMLKVLHRI